MTNIKYGSVKYNFQGMTIVFHVHANSSFTKCFSFLLTFFTHLYLCPRMLCKKYFGAIRFKPFGMFLAYSMIIIIIFTENFGKRVKHCIPLQEISHCPPLWRPMITVAEDPRGKLPKEFSICASFYRFVNDIWDEMFVHVFYS